MQKKELTESLIKLSLQALEINAIKNDGLKYVKIFKKELNVTIKENLELLKNIFNAKKVPLKLLSRIEKYKEYHRSDFSAVKDTVKAGVDLKEFDFYFNYVVNKCKYLKSLWKI